VSGWVVFGILAGAFSLGVVVGLALGVFTMAKVLQDEWRELRGLLAPPPAESAQLTLDWDMRVSPERYLERLPDGEHAGRAREIVERKKATQRAAIF
jgi:hypothetical protein